MQITGIPFGTTNWSRIEQTEHKGERGFAYWRTRQFEHVRVRIVECTPRYLADHWCSKGHLIFCLEGELDIELVDGRRFNLVAGMSCQIPDNAEPHRSRTEIGAKLIIVD